MLVEEFLPKCTGYLVPHRWFRTPVSPCLLEQRVHICICLCICLCLCPPWFVCLVVQQRPNLMQSSEQSEQCVDLAKFPPSLRNRNTGKAKQILANFPYGKTYSKNSCSFWQGAATIFGKVIIFSAICSVNFWAQTLINLPFKATALFPVNLCSKFEPVKREPPPNIGQCTKE